MKRRVWLVPLLSVCITAGATACTFDERAVAVPPAQVVVHSVLDPAGLEQEVLVERTLSGSVLITDDIRFDARDPINTGGGIPVTKAQVSIAGPDGTFTAAEVQYAGNAASFGAGRYLAKLLIRPGGRYTLTVRTADGSVVTGTTVVPNTPPFLATAGTPPLSFNRDRDTLALSWRSVAAARTYGVRVESPFGPLLLFSDSTHLQLAGQLRNVFASDLRRLFIPGFLQTYTIYAVDTNYFDYYRSRNDPFTGSGIINRLQGGIGLFGASVVIGSRTLDVTQQPVDPVLEGDYELSQGPAMARPYIDVMRLYVETPGTTVASLSGWYSRDRKLPSRDGIAGARDGTRIELQLLDNQDARRRLATFVGTPMGDSLVGAYTGVTGRVVLRKIVRGSFSDVAGRPVLRRPVVP